MLEQRPQQLVVANRTVSKAEELAEQFADHGPIAASSFDTLHGVFDVVINATSASLSSELPPIAPDTIGPATLAYDMMYGKEPTVFMRFAAERGATVRDGLGMLVEQAAEAFYVWRGVRPDTAPVYDVLRAALQAT